MQYKKSKDFYRIEDPRETVGLKDQEKLQDYRIKKNCRITGSRETVGLKDEEKLQD